MAKNGPLRATSAHVGIVGHITKHRALQALIDAGRLKRAAIRDPRSDRTLTVWRPANEPAAAHT